MTVTNIDVGYALMDIYREERQNAELISANLRHWNYEANGWCAHLDDEYRDEIKQLRAKFGAVCAVMSLGEKFENGARAICKSIARNAEAQGREFPTMRMTRALARFIDSFEED